MDDEEISIISSKGGNVLLYGGHRFHKHVNNKNGTTLWRCENYKTTKSKCTGSVTINSVSISLSFTTMKRWCGVVFSSAQSTHVT